MQKSSRQPAGFTFVEVLVAVVIMAIVVVAILPQFSDSADAAKTSIGSFDLHTLRLQIELYKLEHAGMTPTQQLIELASATNLSGTVGTSGADFPYGPYLTSIPANPITGSNTVVAAPPAGATPTTVTPGAGWQYDTDTGKIWFNDDTYYPFSQQ
ncbi:MAG TPA: prepilin-type N-terminal cleavage/methylation domain-containing protein [Pirellulales bacterium]